LGVVFQICVIISPNLAVFNIENDKKQEKIAIFHENSIKTRLGMVFARLLVLRQGGEYERRYGKERS
jgi:hypothetical protein